MKKSLCALAMVASALAGGAGAATATTTVRVPNVAGSRLDVAELLLQRQSLRSREIGGGLFGIVVKSNWQVCQTYPRGGTRVARRTAVSLVVARPGDCY